MCKVTDSIFEGSVFFLNDRCVIRRYPEFSMPLPREGSFCQWSFLFKSQRIKLHLTFKLPDSSVITSIQSNDYGFYHWEKIMIYSSSLVVSRSYIITLEKLLTSPLKQSWQIVLVQWVEKHKSGTAILLILHYTSQWNGSTWNELMLWPIGLCNRNEHSNTEWTWCTIVLVTSLMTKEVQRESMCFMSFTQKTDFRSKSGRRPREK